jgi:hypothetical protein
MANTLSIADALLIDRNINVTSHIRNIRDRASGAHPESRPAAAEGATRQRLERIGGSGALIIDDHQLREFCPRRCPRRQTGVREGAGAGTQADESKPRAANCPVRWHDWLRARDRRDDKSSAPCCTGQCNQWLSQFSNVTPLWGWLGSALGSRINLRLPGAFVQARDYYGGLCNQPP